MVVKGQKIALSGSTGLTIGAHLHFGMKLNENDKDNGYFGKIDPAPFLGLVAEAKVLGANSGNPPLRVITWDLSMKKGDVTTIGYQFSTSDAAPQLYTLGPVQFFDQDKVQVFRDTRLWSMHSSDPFTTPKWEGTVKTLKLGGQSIDFPYTDENSDENIIIKTDKKTYFDIGKTNVYFSVTNIGDQAENVKLQAQFPEDKGDVKNIWKYTENIPYQVDVPDYGLKSYTCESGWSQIVEDTSSYYVCQSQQAHQSCSRLSSDTTTCYDDSAYLGTTHKETRYKNDWQIVKASNASLTIDEHGGKGILARATLKRKFIPRNFKVRKSTQQDPYTIKPNETQYFKMEVTYPQRSSGEFYIEAVGDKDGYGLLDPYWDTGWGYRKSIAITGAGTAGTNYQKQIIVNYSSGGDVTCSSHCNADFGDVRFTASDGSTPLSYWQQSYTSSSTSTFFVKVTNNISSGNNTTIYMYYGKAGATTTSSGNDTFDFFDDFSGNLSKWTKENELGTITQAGGYVEMGGGITSGNYGHTVLGSSASYTGFQDGVVEFKHYHAANSIGEVSFRGNYAGNTGYKGRFDARSGSEQVFLMPPYSGWGNIGTAVTKWISASTWYDGKLVIHGSTLEIYDNGSLKQSMTDSTYSSAGEISLQNHYGTYTRYDDVRVRKYSATEPSFGTIGGEEVSGPSNDLLFRHGEWFSAGVKQPFTF
jgi:hypothetical protein